MITDSLKIINTFYVDDVDLIGLFVVLSLFLVFGSISKLTHWNGEHRRTTSHSFSALMCKCVYITWLTVIVWLCCNSGSSSVLSCGFWWLIECLFYVKSKPNFQSNRLQMVYGDYTEIEYFMIWQHVVWFFFHHHYQATLLSQMWHMII